MPERSQRNLYPSSRVLNVHNSELSSNALAAKLQGSLQLTQILGIGKLGYGLFSVWQFKIFSFDSSAQVLWIQTYVQPANIFCTMITHIDSLKLPNVLTLPLVCHRVQMALFCRN